MGEDTSVLAKLPRVRVAGLSARLEGTCVRLRVQPAAGEHLARALAAAPRDAAFAFLTELDSGADGLLVWTPGTEQLQAATPEGSRGLRVSLCFVGFGVGTEVTGGRIIEDGALLTCTTQEWERFRRAVGTGEPLTIATASRSSPASPTWPSA